MKNPPGNLKYTKSHEWVELNADGTVTIGITDHAQDLLGDLVYVEAPEVGKKYKSGDACAVVESVKAASDVYAPISGEVVAINESLSDTPETINNDAHGEGWIFRMKPSDKSELDKLLDAAAYKALAESDAH